MKPSSIVVYINRRRLSCSVTGEHRSLKTLAPVVLRHHFSMVLPFRTIYVLIKNYKERVYKIKEALDPSICRTVKRHRFRE